VVNIGNNVETSIKSLAEKIIDITKSKSKIIYLPPLKEGDMTRRKPDNSKMLKVINRNLMPIDEGLRLLLKEGLFESNN